MAALNLLIKKLYPIFLLLKVIKCSGFEFEDAIKANANVLIKFRSVCFWGFDS